jgi:hypothetical protein
MGLSKTIRRSLINLRGLRTDRKLVVIESDDWGSIRMPSRDVYDRLEREGCEPGKDPYLRYDSIESNADLEQLFQVLRSVRDGKGGHAVLTANAVMANPDFDRIGAGDLRTYHFEPFTDTLARYEGRDRVLQLWKEGMHQGIFIPQYHGREHLHVAGWMADLQNGDAMLRKAFDNRMISISSVPGPMRFGYMEGMDHRTEEERLAKKEILISGHELFRRIVGYGSKSFIANCYIWDDTVEQVLAGEGVKMMQGILNQLVPSGNGKHLYRKHYMGERNSLMAYAIRNVFFEPSLDSSVNWADEAMERIGIAFFWKKPAVIGSHRLNYIGSIDPGNRDRNLDLLGDLLGRIVKKWPEVEFISSADLAEIIAPGP